MAWDHTYDVNTPAGTDDPKEGDDRIREVKAALQERLAKDHYFPKTGSEVSDTAAGEHKKVTLRVGDAPTKADNKGFIYVKDVSAKAELFYRDEDGDEIQITDGGIIKGVVSGLTTKTGTFTAGKIVKINNASGIIEEGTNTNTDVADAVTKKHAQSHNAASHSDIASSGADIDLAVAHKDLTDNPHDTRPKIHGAVGTSNIDTSSTSYVDMTNMSITQTFKAGDIFISFNAPIRLVTVDGNCYCYIAIEIDNVVKIETQLAVYSTTSGTISGNINWKETLSAGSHTIKIQWKTTTGRQALQEGASYKRVLNIIEGR